MVSEQARHSQLSLTWGFTLVTLVLELGVNTALLPNTNTWLHKLFDCIANTLKLGKSYTCTCYSKSHVDYLVSHTHTRTHAHTHTHSSLPCNILTRIFSFCQVLKAVGFFFFETFHLSLYFIYICIFNNIFTMIFLYHKCYLMAVLQVQFSGFL